MRSHHNGRVFFQDLDEEAKRECLRVAYILAKEQTHYSVRHTPDNIRCTCPLIREESTSFEVWQLHTIMSDHVPMHQCVKCKRAIPAQLIAKHRRFDCDNQKTGHFLNLIQASDIEFLNRFEEEAIR